MNMTRYFMKLNKLWCILQLYIINLINFGAFFSLQQYICARRYKCLKKNKYLVVVYKTWLHTYTDIHIETWDGITKYQNVMCSRMKISRPNLVASLYRGPMLCPKKKWELNFYNKGRHIYQRRNKKIYFSSLMSRYWQDLQSTCCFNLHHHRFRDTILPTSTTSMEKRARQECEISTYFTYYNILMAKHAPPPLLVLLSYCFTKFVAHLLVTNHPVSVLFPLLPTSHRIH